jgi:transposase
MEIIRVGVDLAKNVFQLHGVDTHEKPVWRRSLRRGQWLQEVERRVAPGAEIGMEACAGAHHWGASARVSSQADGAAVCEAVREEQQE